MTQLQQFLFELSFGQTRKIREYMLKRYNVYCGSMKDLEQAINLSTCYSTGFNAIAITILTTAAEMLSIVFGPMTSRNKSIKCESFTICCRLNLSGLQENKLMNMQQEWA